MLAVQNREGRRCVALGGLGAPCLPACSAGLLPDIEKVKLQCRRCCQSH